MTDKKTRWQKADDNFRFQIGVLRAKSGMSVAKIAGECDVSFATLYRYLEHPSSVTKRVERRLAMLFEENGLRYDPTLGEGVNA